MGSNDPDFEEIKTITLLKTKDIIDLVGFFEADRPNKPGKQEEIDNEQKPR